MKTKIVLIPIIFAGLLSIPACTTTDGIEQGGMNTQQDTLTYNRLLSPFVNDTQEQSLKLEAIPGNQLEVGQPLRFKIRSNKSGFVQLYVFQTSGEVTTLLENAPIEANEIIYYPDLHNKIRLTAREPVGKNAVLILLTKTPIAGSIKHDFQKLSRPSHIRSTQSGAAAMIFDQIRHMPKSNWQSDTLIIQTF